MSNISKIRIDSGEYDIKDTSAVSSVTRSGDTVTVVNRSGNSNTFSAKSILPSAVNIDGISFTGGASINHYGTCSTSGATATKVVTITGTFTLEAGAKIFVNFDQANTADSPALNVASTGAKNVFHKGSQITTGTNKELLVGVCEFIYDGTQWHLVGNYPNSTGNTTYTIASGDANGQIKVTPSDASAYNVDVTGLGTAAYSSKALRVTISSVSGISSSAFKYYTATGVKDTMVVANSVLGTPSAQTSAWTIETGTDRLGIKGTISGTTSLELILVEPTDVTATAE